MSAKLDLSTLNQFEELLNSLMDNYKLSPDHRHVINKDQLEELRRHAPTCAIIRGCLCVPCDCGIQNVSR